MIVTVVLGVGGEEADQDLVLMNMYYPTLDKVSPATTQRILEDIKIRLRIKEVVKYVTVGEAIDNQDKKIKIIKHSLGLDSGKEAYRNFYAVSEKDTETLSLLEDMVKDELMELGRAAFGLLYFGVTDKGIKFLEETK